MTVTAGPLTWPALTPPCTAASLGISDEQLALAAQISVEKCWALSGRFYGTRDTVYRPQALFSKGCCGSGLDYLVSIYGPFGWPFSGDPREAETKTMRQVLELLRPAVSLTQVQIEGQVIDPDVYRLEGNFLVRQDGGEWPISQNMIAPLGQPNTWAVHYTRGVVPSAEAVYAAGVLACELGKQMAGSKCRLAFNATTVTRAGVTVNRDILMAARTTGVQEVDQWVVTVNPAGLQREPTVWSPDVARNQSPFAGSTFESTNWAPVEITVGGPIDGGGPGDVGEFIMDGGGP